MLRPGGRLLFIEHVRSDDPKLAKTQDRMNGVNKFLVGCECNRATLDTIKAEGFEVDSLEQTTLNKVPKFVRPAIVGAALPPPNHSSSAKCTLNGMPIPAASLPDAANSGERATSWNEAGSGNSNSA